MINRDKQNVQVMAHCLEFRTKENEEGRDRKEK